MLFKFYLIMKAPKLSINRIVMENDQVNPNLEHSAEKEKLNTGKRHVFNFILTSFSIESSSHFNKVHKRRFHSFGNIHQLGKLPGAML